MAWESLIAFRQTETVKEPRRPPRRRGIKGRHGWGRRSLRRACSDLIALGVIIYVSTDYGRIKITVDGPKAEVQVDGEQIFIKTPRESITLRAGPHELAVKWGDGEFKTRTFVVRRGGSEELRVEYEPTSKGPVTSPRPKPPSPVPELDFEAPTVGFKALFNGKDLDRLEKGSQTAGPLACRKRRPDWLRSDHPATSTRNAVTSPIFTCASRHVSTKSAAAACTSAVRSARVLPADDPKWPDGYEATINNARIVRDSTGGLYPGVGNDVFIADFIPRCRSDSGSRWR